ncbi:MAG: hypothetical protein AAGG02_11135 [Cyanobacteria bacterium P01_H01_bin.15]
MLAGNLSERYRTAKEVHADLKSLHQAKSTGGETANEGIRDDKTYVGNSSMTMMHPAEQSETAGAAITIDRPSFCAARRN